MSCKIEPLFGGYTLLGGRCLGKSLQAVSSLRRHFLSISFIVSKYVVRRLKASTVGYAEDSVSLPEHAEDQGENIRFTALPN